MKIRNVSGEAREIAATQQIVEDGDTVDLDDDTLAKSLLEQPANWERVKGPDEPKSKPVKKEN